MNLVENAKHIMVGTGAAWVMWLLIGLSVFSIAVILERAYTYWVRRDDIDALREALAKSLRSGGFDDAREAMKQSRHPAAYVALRGMRRAAEDTSPEEAAEAMAAEAIVQKQLLDSRLGFLGTLGSNAPFIGLFGTVIGIVQAFDELGKTAKNPAATAAGAATAAAPQAVMSSIAEALVATAIGIGVAIPAVFAYNYFLKSMKTSMQGSDVLSKEILAYLHSDKAPARGGELDMAGGTQSEEDEAIVGINVTPLVDVTLVLLVVFIVTAKIIVTSTLPMDLPKAATGSEQQTVFSVELSAAGETAVDSKKVPSEDAILALAREAHSKNAELRAVIKADAAVPHGRVVRVMDLLKQAGVAKVAFGVSPTQAETGAAPAPAGSK